MAVPLAVPVILITLFLKIRLGEVEEKIPEAPKSAPILVRPLMYTVLKETVAVVPPVIFNPITAFELFALGAERWPIRLL